MGDIVSFHRACGSRPNQLPQDLIHRSWNSQALSFPHHGPVDGIACGRGALLEKGMQ